REQVFQIVLGQAARETFLAQHVADGLGLALLEFPDFFLDGSRGDESVGIDGAGLADAMRAIDGLGFDGRVPPGIIEHDVTGGGEVQAGARGAEDRKSTRLNSSHEWISYAVFCLKKKIRKQEMS